LGTRGRVHCGHCRNYRSNLWISKDTLGQREGGPKERKEGLIPVQERPDPQKRKNVLLEVKKKAHYAKKRRGWKFSKVRSRGGLEGFGHVRQGDPAELVEAGERGRRASETHLPKVWKISSNCVVTIATGSSCAVAKGGC